LKPSYSMRRLGSRWQVLMNGQPLGYPSVFSFDTASKLVAELNR
jgi:hypothetical protein